MIYTCTKCHATKPLEGFHFHKRTNRPDTRCRDCVNAYLKGRRSDLAVVASQTESHNKWSRRKRAQDANWGRYSSKTPAQKRGLVDAVRRWRERNKATFNGEARLSIHIRRSLAYVHGWPLVVAHYGNACVSCGGAATCFDHVVPLSAGGLNQLVNGQPLCRACNTFKGQLPDKTKDWRPDGGAWIMELIRLNPWLVVPVAGKRGSKCGPRRSVAPSLVLPSDDRVQQGATGCT